MAIPDTGGLHKSAAAGAAAKAASITISTGAYLFQYAHGHYNTMDAARRRVADARAYGFPAPYICIYRDLLTSVHPMGEITMPGHAEPSRCSPPRIAVLHIPHSSRQVPAEERGAIWLDDLALDAELLRMPDASIDLLFPATAVEAGRLVFPVSRLVYRCRALSIRCG